MAQAPSLPEPVWRALILVALAGSGLAVALLSRSRSTAASRVGGSRDGAEPLGIRIRRRFVLGVPWGTLVTIGLVLSVYLFVQGGLSGWWTPVTVPFRAWSYFFPRGVLLAGFSHVGPNHLIGNLLGTLVFGSLAEYAWGHFPTERGTTTFSGPTTNPFVRAMAVPAAAVLAAVLTAAFGLGPVIGFSGTVFALAGFALVRYPLAALVALAVGDVVRLLYRALRTPELFTEAAPSFDVPWWSQVAIQGHALGIVLGVVVGASLFRRRGTVPTAGRLFVGVVGYAVAQNLWAVYLILGNSRFALYRGLGVVLVLALGVLATAAVVASDRPVVPSTDVDLSRRGLAFIVTVSLLLALSLVAVPFNLLQLQDDAVPDEATVVEVREYAVFYAENEPYRLTTPVEIPFYEATNVTQSGVFVVSPDREIWANPVSKGRLATLGRSTVRVGGVGWRASLVADRTGWGAAGGPTTYKVFFDGRDRERRLAYAADPATAEPIVDGRNVTVVPTEAGFALDVTRNDERLGRAPMPTGNATTTAGGLTFARNGTRVFASVDGTRVRVATKERYKQRP